MKSIYKIIFLTLIFIGSISYEAKADIVYANDYSTKTNTDTGAVYKRTKTAVTWAIDNITKTTTYTFADKTTHAVVAEVQPDITTSISGIIKTTVTTYGNKKKITTKETATLVDGSVSYGSNFSSKSATYRFLDSSTIEVTRLLSKTAITWARDNITKTTTYTFADKTTYVDTVTVTPTVAVSWAADHITKTTITTYGNGKKLSVITQVPGTVGTPTYNNNIKTVVTTYGDGTSSTATFTASSSSDSWASDHITKTTTHTYASGGSNSIITTVNPTSTTPALTNAVYPSDWTTTGTVTPPNVSSKTNTYGDGYTNVAEDGTSSKPFLQTTLSGLSISDPSKYVTSNTTTYDLRWGTPDKNGPLYKTIIPNFPYTLSAYGIPVGGYNFGSGPTFTTPSEDVLAAWNNGWTGFGKNILTIDTYENAANCNPLSSNNLLNCHGITTALISGLTTAIAATPYLLDSSGTASIRNFDGTVATPASMNVVNLSYTYIGANAQINSNTATSFLGSNYQGFDLSNAVITKAAGNDAVTSNNDVFSKTLADNSNTAARLLIVGALNGNGSLTSRVDIADYSNTAGTYAPVANRFVLANGNAPWATGGVYINYWLIPGPPINVGTSYAAPLVAGYAAIIQQKFPGLNAANTSNIILDTARYDTLTCYPSCDTSIYGKGEASLSRALAPVGRLR